MSSISCTKIVHNTLVSAIAVTSIMGATTASAQNYRYQVQPYPYSQPYTGAGSTLQPSQQYFQQQEEQRRRAETYYYRPAQPQPPVTYGHGHVDRSMGSMGFAPNVIIRNPVPERAPFPFTPQQSINAWGKSGECYLGGLGAMQLAPKHPYAQAGAFTAGCISGM